MTTWYPHEDPAREFLLQEAQDFLEKDFMKNLLRVRHLYVETPPKEEIGHGMFEPIILCLTWCDFLGALYCGDGIEHRDGGLGSTQRSRKYIEEVLGKINPKYVEASEELVRNYRNGLVHGYVPVRFHIRYGSPECHLNQEGMGIVIDNPTLIDNMIDSVRLFSESLVLNGDKTQWGSLIVLNKGRYELLSQKRRYLAGLKKLEE